VTWHWLLQVIPHQPSRHGAAVDENLKGIRVSILATLKNDLVFEEEEEEITELEEDQYNNQQQ
jgi:hypothetical protein